MNKQQMIKRVKNIANLVQMFSSKIDVKFVSMPTAATDGKTVWIRMGDFSDPDYVKMVVGLAYHEAGHVAHSDFTATAPGAWKRVQNALEDARMESLVKRDFLGAATHLNNVVKQILGCDDLDAYDKKCAIAELFVLVHSYCLLRGRALHNNDICLLGQMDIVNKHLLVHIGQDKLTQLNELIDQLPHTKTESDVVGITLGIRALLNSQDENKPENPDDSGDSSGDADSNDDADPDDSGDSSGDADSNDDADPDDSGDSSGDADSNDDANPDDSGKSQDNQSNPSSSKYPNSLDDADVTDCPDMHEQLREQVDAEADKNASDDADEICRIANAALGALKQEDINFNSNADFSDANALVNKLTLTFRRAFMDDERIKRKYIRENGVLDGNRLIDLVTIPDKAALFRNEARAKTTSATVSIIVDASSSMRGNNRSLIANSSAYAIARALDNLPFIQSEIRYMVGNTSYVAKHFDEKTNPSKFAVKPFGGTPTALLVQSAIMSTVSRSARKKLIIVITDGQADCVQSLNNAVSDAQCFGIGVKGIGIQCPTYGIDDGVIIENVQDLPHELMQAVKQGIFT